MAAELEHPIEPSLTPRPHYVGQILKLFPEFERSPDVLKLVTGILDSAQNPRREDLQLHLYKHHCWQKDETASIPHKFFELLADFSSGTRPIEEGVIFRIHHTLKRKSPFHPLRTQRTISFLSRTGEDKPASALITRELLSPHIPMITGPQIIHAKPEHITTDLEIIAKYLKEIHTSLNYGTPRGI